MIVTAFVIHIHGQISLLGIQVNFGLRSPFLDNTVVRCKKLFSLHLKLVISVIFFRENGSINEAMREKDSKKRESFTIEYPQS